MLTLRNEIGQFKSGNSGYWLGKKRPNLSQANNSKWVGDKNNHICIICSKEFRRPIPKSGKPKFCSMLCYGKSKVGQNKGEKNNRWKGGITPFNRSLRHSKQYDEWRKAVYKRDYWTCQICKRHLKQLVAHHIKTFEKYPELRFEITNGLTLCRACHCKIHAENRITDDFTKILRDYMPNIA